MVMHGRHGIDLQSETVIISSTSLMRFRKKNRLKMKMKWYAHFTWDP